MNWRIFPIFALSILFALAGTLANWYFRYRPLSFGVYLFAIHQTTESPLMGILSLLVMPLASALAVLVLLGMLFKRKRFGLVTGSLAVLAILLLIIGNMTVSYATSSATRSVTVEPGVSFPCDFSDYQDDGQTVAHNCRTGVNSVYTDAQSAIQFSFNNGRAIWIENGTSSYLINSGLVFPSQVVVRSDGAILRNNAGLTFPFITPSNQTWYRGEISGLVFDAGSVVNGYGLYLQSPQDCKVDVTVKNAYYGIRITYAVGAANTDSTIKTNAAFCEYNLRTDNTSSVALQLDGQSPSGAVVTDNHFNHVTETRVSGEGIRFVQWVDDNIFDYAFVSVVANNAVGAVFNDSPTSGIEVGVYQEVFASLAVDAFGGLSGVSGVLINDAKDIFIFNMYGSPVPPFPGTFINAKSSAISYYIVDAYSVQNSVRIVELGGPGLVLEKNLSAQTATATVASYIVPSSGPPTTYWVSGYVVIRGYSSGTLNYVLSWTDETSTVRTLTLASLSATGYTSIPVQSVRALPGTTISVTTTGTFALTYDIGAELTQVGTCNC